jgi:hypothetical protein
LQPFGIWHIFLTLVCFTKKNLATLNQSHFSIEILGLEVACIYVCLDMRSRYEMFAFVSGFGVGGSFAQQNDFFRAK